METSVSVVGATSFHELDRPPMCQRRRSCYFPLLDLRGEECGKNTVLRLHELIMSGMEGSDNVILYTAC